MSIQINKLCDPRDQITDDLENAFCKFLKIVEKEKDTQKRMSKIEKFEKPLLDKLENTIFNLNLYETMGIFPIDDLLGVYKKEIVYSEISKALDDICLLIKNQIHE